MRRHGGWPCAKPKRGEVRWGFIRAAVEEYGGRKAAPLAGVGVGAVNYVTSGSYARSEGDCVGEKSARVDGALRRSLEEAETISRSRYHAQPSPQPPYLPKPSISPKVSRRGDAEMLTM